MPDQVKGTFGIGVERISKPMTLGNRFSSAHALAASLLAAIAADHSRRAAIVFGAERAARGPELPEHVHGTRISRLGG